MVFPSQLVHHVNMCGAMLLVLFSHHSSVVIVPVLDTLELALPYIGSANRNFKITYKVLLCVGVGLIKKTLTWQQIPCIPCSVKIEKYLQIEPFSAVAILNFFCCNQSFISGLVTIFPIILGHK